MKRQFSRRSFVKSGALAGCLLLASGKISTAAFNQLTKSKIDPKKLNYCGYSCPDDCKFLIASIKNDPVLKKEAYEIWEMDTRFGVKEFDPEKIFCFGCKNPDKPVGIRLQKCDIRQCAIEKKFESCIECSELKECENNLWKKFPEFKKQVIQMQATYLGQKS